MIAVWVTSIICGFVTAGVIYAGTDHALRAMGEFEPFQSPWAAVEGDRVLEERASRTYQANEPGAWASTFIPGTERWPPPQTAKPSISHYERFSQSELDTVMDELRRIQKDRISDLFPIPDRTYSLYGDPAWPDSLDCPFTPIGGFGRLETHDSAPE